MTQCFRNKNRLLNNQIEICIECKKLYHVVEWEGYNTNKKEKTISIIFWDTVTLKKYGSCYQTYHIKYNGIDFARCITIKYKHIDVIKGKIAIASVIIFDIIEYILIQENVVNFFLCNVEGLKNNTCPNYEKLQDHIEEKCGKQAHFKCTGNTMAVDVKDKFHQKVLFWHAPNLTKFINATGKSLNTTNNDGKYRNDEDFVEAYHCHQNIPTNGEIYVAYNIFSNINVEEIGFFGVEDDISSNGCEAPTKINTTNKNAKNNERDQKDNFLNSTIWIIFFS